MVSKRYKNTLSISRGTILDDPSCNQASRRCMRRWLRSTPRVALMPTFAVMFLRSVVRISRVDTLAANNINQLKVALSLPFLQSSEGTPTKKYQIKLKSTHGTPRFNLKPERLGMARKGERQHDGFDSQEPFKLNHRGVSFCSSSCTYKMQRSTEHRTRAPSRHLVPEAL